MEIGISLKLYSNKFLASYRTSMIKILASSHPRIKDQNICVQNIK